MRTLMIVAYLATLTVHSEAKNGKINYKLPGLKDYISFITPPRAPPLALSSVGLNVPGATAVKFYVRACDDVRILLHPDAKSLAREGPANVFQESTEIVLGQDHPPNNTHISYIRPCLFPNKTECAVEEVHAVNPLHCFMLKPFWISWVKPDLQVGQGHAIGKNLLMKLPIYTAKPLQFDVIFVTTGTSAYWVFPPHQEIIHIPF